MRLLLLLFLGLILITTAIYWPVYRFGLVDFDDTFYLKTDPHIRQGLTVDGVKDAFCHPYFANYAPLVSISYELDQSLFKQRLGAMHVENVLLHLLAGLLLWRVLVVSTGKPWAGWVVAAIFLCHPMHVESVAWIAERKDVLSIPLLLMAMLAYLRFVRTPEKRRWWFYLLMLICFAASLLTKAMGVTFPAILLLMDAWPLRRWTGKNTLRLIVEKIPLMLMSVTISVAESLAQSEIGATSSLNGLSLVNRINNAIVCYVIYITKLLVPTDLAVFYQHPGSRPVAAVVAALGLLGLITFLCRRVRHRAPYAMMGWLWFLGTLVPVIGLEQVGSQAMADRYSYLPSIGLAIAIVWGVAQLIRNRAARTILAASVIVIYSVLAYRQVWVWKDTQSLFTHAVLVTDDNSVAHTMLARVAVEHGDIHRAVDEFQAAVRYRDYAAAYSGLANCWIKDDPDRAIAYCRKAVQMSPKDIRMKLQLADELRQTGQLDEAKQVIESALAVEPGDADLLAERDRIKNTKP